MRSRTFSVDMIRSSPPGWPERLFSCQTRCSLPETTVTLTSPRTASRRHLPAALDDLRHTFGSLLAASGIDLVTIQAACASIARPSQRCQGWPRRSKPSSPFLAQIALSHEERSQLGGVYYHTQPAILIVQFARSADTPGIGSEMMLHADGTARRDGVRGVAGAGAEHLSATAIRAWAVWDLAGKRWLYEGFW